MLKEKYIKLYIDNKNTNCQDISSRTPLWSWKNCILELCRKTLGTFHFEISNKFAYRNRCNRDYYQLNVLFWNVQSFHTFCPIANVQRDLLSKKNYLFSIFFTFKITESLFFVIPNLYGGYFRLFRRCCVVYVYRIKCVRNYTSCRHLWKYEGEVIIRLGDYVLYMGVTKKRWRKISKCLRTDAMDIKNKFFILIQKFCSKVDCWKSLAVY